MPQTNPKYTSYAINSNAGAFTVIRLTTFAKYVEIYEDPNANAGVQQGLQFNNLSPFAQSSNITENCQPPAPDFGIVLAVTNPPPGAFQPQLTFGDMHNIHSGTEAPLGNPGSAGFPSNPNAPASLGTPLVQLRSNSGTATAVVVREWA
jgi:hypothetical protein